ncbi:NAD(P)-binding protein [Trichoderma citrinoviride]|uniref:NAD(P)-binding protein n=1 Tax=Trichoderma citrinoviride TaxID=58853 RepID=A0A2T4BGQ3_9HYPO|nr:NAD(P)-binding protein [Trichoderma citrinoviride]PTB68505.1 NAD(P)-binding protein [Trichoderma citrinoviride]
MASNNNFGAETTAEEVASAFRDQIAGKTILITGVSPNGLGAAMAHALAKYEPANLIFTARTVSKASAVADAIRSESSGLKTQIHVVKTDLSDLESTRQGAAAIQKLTPHIDIMINNAGVMAIPEREINKNGLEAHLATNFLGHFVLTTLLLPQLKAAGPKARVVNIVSGGFYVQPFRFSDYNFDGDKELPGDEKVDLEMAEKFGMGWVKDAGTGYVPFLAYSQTSTALMLFCKGLNEGLSGDKITSVTAAPGVVLTELQRHLPGEFRNPKMVYKTASQGAASFLVAALDPSLADHPGAYIDDCQIKETPQHARDDAAARKLWSMAQSWAEAA